MDFAPGEFHIVHGKSDSFVTNLFYVALGLVPLDGGEATIGGESIEALLAPGVSVRGGPLAIVDLRSALPHRSTLLDHVAEGAAGDVQEAASWLEKVGVLAEFHGCVPGAAGLAEIPEGATPLFGFDADRKRFFGLLSDRLDLADELLVRLRIPMPILYPFRGRPPMAKGEDPADWYVKIEREKAGWTRDRIVAEWRELPDAEYRGRLSRYTKIQRQETAWAYALKLAEVARALASHPAWFFVLDTVRVAGQATLAPVYDRLVEWTLEQDPRPGVVLFAPKSMAPFDDLAVRATERSEDPTAHYAKPRFSDVIADSKAEERGIEFKIRGLSHSYDGKTWIVRNIDLDFAPARTMVVMGGSGCGKSTILRLAAGLEKPPEGLVMIRGKAFNGENVKPDNERRKEMGVLFQDGALFQSMTVSQNVSAPILEHTGLHPNVVDIMVGIKLDLVEMLEHKDKKPSELSGGQKKRVGLARALALDPGAIFYDEPSAGLDPIVSRGIDVLMNKLGEVLGVTSIIITHELDSAFTIADRMVVLRKANAGEDEYWVGAQAVATGNPEEIKASVHPHVIEFLDAFSYHRASPVGKRRSWWRDPLGD